MPDTRIRRSRSWRSWRSWRRILSGSLLCAFGLAWVGCTSSIQAPRDPRDPVTVFLIHDSAHCGLVLPRAGGTLVEYGYGDWDWYALGYDSWYHVFDTVLWPTQGTLARREIPEQDGDGLRRRYPWIQMDPLVVPRQSAHDLLARLDAEFASRSSEQHHNPAYGMTFVPHEDGYWFLHNCNDGVADWLRALECSVSWVPIRLGLTVIAP